jgi:hypothetical protein
MWHPYVLPLVDAIDYLISLRLYYVWNAQPTGLRSLARHLQLHYSWSFTFSGELHEKLEARDATVMCQVLQSNNPRLDEDVPLLPRLRDAS